LDFVAIDFETANSHPHSACAIGLVSVKAGKIEKEYYTLIQPPDNIYYYHNTRVHGISASDTLHAPTFDLVFPEICKIMKGRRVVAHNESFDRNVLYHTMDFYDLDYADLKIKARWECTVKLARKRKEYPANLKACCQRHGIALNHHDALSDALACAKLFLIYNQPLFAL
jgi:DNA polymerase III subunit epsilon